MTWDGTGLPPWRVIPAALDAGAISGSDVVRKGVQVDQVGRSHAVYRVSVGDEPRFFVKSFGPSRGATDGLAARERSVHRLARERPAVAALVPDEWHWEVAVTGDDGQWPVVATVAVRGSEAWTLDHPGGGTRTVDEAWAELVAALVPPLAAFHRATRDLARPDALVPPGLEPIVPWGLCLMDGDAAPELWSGGVTAVLLHEAASDPGLVRGLRAARAQWRPLALVHADLKHDNVLVEPTADGLRVCLLDWEMARVGDPAWDLASLTARVLVARGDTAPWSDTDLDAAALIVSRYAGASGLGVSPLAQRLALYVGGVLLMMALQQAAALGPAADLTSARQLVMRSRATFARIDWLTAAVVAKAHATAP